MWLFHSVEKQYVCFELSCVCEVPLKIYNNIDLCVFSLYTPITSNEPLHVFTVTFYFQVYIPSTSLPIFSYWKSIIMFHSDKVNTLLLPRPAAQVHFPKQCLKTCRPTNSMSKFQRCLLQRNILVLNMVKVFRYEKKNVHLYYPYRLEYFLNCFSQIYIGLHIKLIIFC